MILAADAFRRCRRSAVGDQLLARRCRMIKKVGAEGTKIELICAVNPIYNRRGKGPEGLLAL